MTPSLTADPNYNRIIPNENVTVMFGDSVIIECKYGTTFRNLSLYCGESGVAQYDLLGDNRTCPGLRFLKKIIFRFLAYQKFNEIDQEKYLFCHCG